MLAENVSQLISAGWSNVKLFILTGEDLTTKTFSLTEGKGKLKNSRMRADYEFLKNLENILHHGVETFDSAEREDIMETREGMKTIVQEAITFLEERDEFWTNVK